MDTKPNILILGNRGFIGAALYKHLKDIGNFQVKGYNSSNLNLVSPDSISNIEKVVDENTVIVFSVRAPQNEDPLKAFEQDISITCNIARLIKKKLLKKFLYFSSTSIYGDEKTNLCIDETTQSTPSSYYGISKFVAEGILQKASREKGTPFVALRPCMIYGPGNKERPYGPDRLIYSLISEGPLDLFGDGKELRDYLFLDDLVKIVEKFITSPCQGVYNLSSGNSVSMLQIIENLEKITGKDLLIKKQERNKPKTDQKLDISKLLKFYPDCTFTPLEEGLRKSYESFQNIQNQEKMGSTN